MDTLNLLTKLESDFPFIVWTHKTDDRFLVNYITGKVNCIRDLNISVEIISEAFSEPLWTVTVSSKCVVSRIPHTDLNAAVNEALKMALNITMAGIIYEDEKGVMRWVESLKQIHEQNSL